MLREARGRKRRWCRSNNVAPTKKKEPKICNRYVANKGGGGEEVRGNRATLLHKKPCTASRSEPQERKHAVSKQDRMREWKIPPRGENRGRPPPSRHPIRTEKLIKRSPDAAPT